jgi:hypothetical protein
VQISGEPFPNMNIEILKDKFPDALKDIEEKFKEFL